MRSFAISFTAPSTRVYPKDSGLAA